MGKTKLVAAAQDYFLRPGMSRFLEAAWKRYEGLGRVGGKAVVRELTPEECDALNGFFGMYLRPGQEAGFRLELFESELLQSPFACTLAELHERLYEEPLLSRADRELVRRQSWQALFMATERRLQAEGQDIPKHISQWWARVRAGDGAGYRTLKELWGRGEALASEALLHATLAWRRLGWLDGETIKPIRKPVLAAEVSGNPHALDLNQPAGRLFFQALLSVSYPGEIKDVPDRAAETGQPSRGADDFDADALDTESDLSREVLRNLDTLAAREVYRRWGVLDDDFSSYVHVFYSGRHQGRWAPRGEVWTLAQVESMSELPPVTELYVVENPAVYASLIESSAPVYGEGQDGPRSGAAPMLLCTSGPASAAALRLLDLYVRSGRLQGSIHYSGDYDGKGIAMANVLWRRHGACFSPWRFDSETYGTAVQGMIAGGLSFSLEECRQLMKLRAEWQPALSAKLLEGKRKLFQEELLPLLEADWRQAQSKREAENR
ncbi:DUF2399 domain-containing protein [Paenibacillus albicereus]|uniref:DUF2399 domain-containing protein n=1 Tax=Paenibacillus albicereus TaxID=2726185 RepID=A0A6H2GSK5_9BACL|nr:TIGR02679 domain-containing protein [Paenibacillus albicereus]QJC50411.1 DUF2399 domain-containing protein [Paenibacillus albicereus]